MTENILRWCIDVDGARTSAIFTRAPIAEGDALFVYAHGAGGSFDDAGMRAVSNRLLARGLDIVRFNFLYRENNSRRPDPMPVLKACFEAVAAHARSALQPKRLIIGGRSMGGRVASMLAADGYPCDGLLLLAYPLHPAGQPHKLRAAHLGEISAPVLCLNGTRDALCRRDLMQQSIDRLGSNWTMHWLEGADHSFHVLRSSGRSNDDVLDEVADAYTGWSRPNAHLHG